MGNVEAGQAPEEPDSEMRSFSGLSNDDFWRRIDRMLAPIPNPDNQKTLRRYLKERLANAHWRSRMSATNLNATQIPKALSFEMTNDSTTRWATFTRDASAASSIVVDAMTLDPITDVRSRLDGRVRDVLAGLTLFLDHVRRAALP